MAQTHAEPSPVTRGPEGGNLGTLKNKGSSPTPEVCDRRRGTEGKKERGKRIVEKNPGRRREEKGKKSDRESGKRD